MKQLLPANLAALTAVAATDATRYCITGLRVRLNEKGYICEATDGHRLVRVEGDYPAAVGDFPGEIPSSDDGPRDLVLAGPRLKTIAKRIKRRVPREVLNHVAIGTTLKESTLIVDDLETRTVDAAKHPEGRFPDTDAVFPTKEPVVKLVFSAKLLASTLKALLDLGLDECDRITLEVHGKDAPLVITATTEDKQKVTALVMPLT